ncbi:MAG: hypothetical protein LBQ02_02540 [Candidatus Nomurabacteria bacterium]|nr:hypothetical protein [Candidatus Nomurabacteria bacterium]
MQVNHKITPDHNHHFLMISFSKLQKANWSAGTKELTPQTNIVRLWLP